ncbi:DNA-3-methyladenine glycosylase I [Candidatus Sumerlaeota bacterium]|nr:DNA-3-methyladenine glycosylase I [Candidatus Sumerlaeota bacterium]
MSIKTPATRCPWPADDPLMIAYHDREWGVPVHDDRLHFEFMILDAMQAGLSWRTVLHKRENFRRAFHNFDPERVARYGARDRTRLLKNAGIIRNRAKIEAAIVNAREFLEVQEEFGSFDKFIWQFTGGKTVRNRHRTIKDLPATSLESDVMSRELKIRGFKFVGSTICYAYMQAAGMVNDHLVGCFRYQEISA